AVAGSYNLTAKAFDDKGAANTSSIVNITVNKANVTPVVNITSPAAGASFTEGANIKIEASATDSDGRITKVEFYRGTTLVGTSTVAPYTVTWSNAVAGSYNLTAKAFDDKGAANTSSIVNITVNKANVTPVVNITSPTAGASFIEGANIKIEASATDSDGKITKVEFYRGTTLIGSSTVAPYAVIWTNANAGNHSLTAKAFDEKSGVATSSPVSVTVTPVVTLPEISLITPIEHQVFEVGSNVSFTVMFNGNSSSVKKVSYFVDEVLVGTSTQSPFNFVWKSSSTGQLKVKAMATGGEPEKTNTSEIVNITVDPVSPIKFDIVSPVKNATFKNGENIEIKVDVPVSSKRIVRVDYFRGNILLGSNSVQPYSFVWNNVNLGVHNLVARLVYDDGSSLLSSVVNVTVEENKEPKVLLNYEISSKGNKKSVDILFGVSFQNLLETISSVEYYLDGVLIGKSEREPYSFTRRNVQGGIYQASAKAIDITGYEFWSENVQVEVSGSIGAKTEEETSVFNYTIGPNPTADYLNVYFEEIESDQQIEIYLVAMKGDFSKTYSAEAENKTLTLDVTDLISGNYVLNIRIEGMTVESKKFIKK
ncbi:MAG: Ig-like domain-containing protein, partial [Cyclobacteriaceae bacterium]|nr:Ig-like domain-containing protein [Cyclobacteriaceae bacterium]